VFFSFINKGVIWLILTPFRRRTAIFIYPRRSANDGAGEGVSRIASLPDLREHGDDE
jgi:hypothetical protein